MAALSAPSTLVALPAATHNLADLERRFQARRAELISRVQSATTAGRALEMFRHAQIVGVDLQPLPAPIGASLTHPVMSYPGGPRSQPRDGRGRFLSRAWLQQAETFTADDLAWFRSPVR